MDNVNRSAWRKVIAAWADGAEVQMCRPQPGIIYPTWEPAPAPIDWDAEGVLYRVKPEKATNIVRRISVGSTPQYDNERWFRPNLELVFSGETGELMSARVLR